MQDKQRACAECRRLKHKCDREVPCANCVKKGCQAICPSGTNQTGDGHRRFWAKQTQMKETLSKLAERIADLESALRTAYAASSTSPHPLLSDDLLCLKKPYLESGGARTTRGVSSHTPPPSDDRSDPSEESDSIVVAMGSLSIGQFGRTNYYGGAAFSAFFVKNEEPAHDLVRDMAVLPLLPLDIAAFGSSSFPLSLLAHPSGADNQERIITLRCFLPPCEEAIRLKNAYYREGVSVSEPISPEEFEHFVLKAIYNTPWDNEVADAAGVLHRLAVMFLVLALGTLFDPTLPIRSIDASKYYELACAALSGSSPVESPTLEAIQALSLICKYIQFSHKATGNGGNALEWTIIGMTVKMAQTMGLHRDPAGFNLSPGMEIERRRRLWWNIYCQDVWGALRWSRPTSVSYDSFDTKMPVLDTATPSNLIYLWRWSFCRDCLEPIQQRVFSVARPSYKTILELDRKVREHPVPELLGYRRFTADDLLPANSLVSLQRTFVSMMRESTILQLHRNHCDAATREHPSNPLASPYGPSVIASFRSAWSLLSVSGTSYELMPHTTARIPCVYYQLFTAAAALSSIISRCPSMKLVPDALAQLERADQLARTWVATIEAESLLRTMSELLENARAGYTAFLTGYPASEEHREAVLSRLCGDTRCVVRRQTARAVAPALNPAAAPFEIPQQEVLHPSVTEYVHTLELGPY